MTSRQMKISELKPGMIVAEALRRNDKLILQQNTVLTANIIRSLSHWGVEAARVKLEIPTTVGQSAGRSHLSAMVREQLIEEDPGFFEKYSEATDLAGKLFHHMRHREDVPYKELYKLATENLYELAMEKKALGNLYKLKPYADYTYLHAVGVGIVSGLIGMWNGLKDDAVKKLILAGLMHDIGKSQIPLHILDKPGKLTPDEQKTMNLHPQYGFYMTKSLPGIPPEVQQAILQHHERENGSGYPAKLTGPQTHLFAKIVAISDVYDALTTDKVYQKSVTPFKATEIFMDTMFATLDRDLCKIFIRHVLHDLIGGTVLLSDGTQAEVMEMSSFMSALPVVVNANRVIIDLNRHPQLSIIEVLKFGA
ncbi:MAG: HD-GYP domain-containing protein [Negativicutes bacterium]|nr:HD-GYP domain-containing protein [Negativicutes bacterium]